MFSLPFLFRSYCHSVIHYCILWLLSVLLRVFLCSPRVVVSMRHRCLQCWQVLFLPISLIHIVCQYRLWDVMLYVWSLVFLSICLSLSLVHSRKGPEYLTRDTAQVFIPLIRFLLLSFVSSSFLVLLRYSFWILSFISTCLMVSASKVPKYL